MINGVDRYTRTAIALHWIVAAAIAVNVVLALTWDFYPDAAVRPAIDTHKSLGITVLGLVIVRLLWRWTHRPPAPQAHHQRWEKMLSFLVHVLLYLAILALPLSGWIMDSAWDKAAANPMYWFGLFEWPRIPYVIGLDPVMKKAVHDGFGEVHENLATILYVLVFLHIAGALKHQFFDKDRTIARMMPGRD